MKSLAVGTGDMFYIDHNSDSFTVIDCSLPTDRAGEILNEIGDARKGNGICRFISSHPDQDHIHGLVKYDDRFRISNFYAVKNKAIKGEETDDFKRYKALRDDTKKTFYLKRGCTRRWLNRRSEERGSAGIHVDWPILTDEEFKKALQTTEDGGSPNNISPVFTYSIENGVKFVWMGDLESDFMEKISNIFAPDPAHVLFAPHHGRKSGRVPKNWLDSIGPFIIVVGEAPSDDLTYYSGYNTITQNSAGDIVFENLDGKTRIYVSKSSYSVGYLEKEIGVVNTHGYYIGTFRT